MNPKDFTNPASGRSFYTPNGFWAFIPAPLPPDLAWSTPLVSALSQAERDLSRLATITREFSIWQSLIQPFIRNEAVLSSRIEGTHTSLPDVYRYEAIQLSFLEQSEDSREVHNYVRAMEYGVARLASFPVSLRLIREIHQVLMDQVRGETSTPGEFRRSQNWIGPTGSTPSTAPYVPPPVDEMHLCLDALEKFIHIETLLPRLIQAGMIHYQFEAIHPFLDGNGRVGRLLVDLLMQEWGYLPQPALNLSVYLERNREAYDDLLLAVSEHGEWNEWLIFFLNGVSQQSNESEGRIRRLANLRLHYQALSTHERNLERMSSVIDTIFSHPILTVAQLRENVPMPYKTALDYVERLIGFGILREITGHARNRIFAADAILNALQGLDPR